MGCVSALAGLGLAASLTLTSADPGADPIRIVTEAPFPPYTLLLPDGQLTGIDKDLMDEICRRNAWDCRWSSLRFDQLLAAVASGRQDLAIGGIAITQDRLRLVDFSDPYDHPGSGADYLGLPGAPSPERARIAVQSGTIYEDFLTDQGRKPLSLPSEGAALQAVLEGRADLALGSFPPEQFQDLPGWDRLSALYRDEIPDQGTGIAVCKGNEALLGPLNSALAAMAEDGTLQAILSRWRP